MKINDIKAFCSDDRKVHVALTSGGSKDGLLSVVRKADPDGKAHTFATVKGDRGRPSLVAPANIESITWHSKVVLAEGAGGKSAKATTEVVKAVEKKDRKFKPLHKADTGKAACGCSGKLKCKAHAAEAGWIGNNGSGKATIAGVTLMLDSLPAEDLAKVIERATARLLQKIAGQ